MEKMKKYKILFFLIITLLLNNCSTWKGSIVSSGSINEAVNNAITDFLTTKLSKKGTIFGVLISDYVGVKYNQENNTVIYIPKNDYIFIISVGKSDNKIYPREENKIGTYDNVFPTMYTIRDEKLFYWSDSTQVISKEIISVLEKYNHIDFEWHKEYDLPPLIINDGGEGIVYYFCKNDLSNYKKKRADTLRRHYRTPKLKCK